MAQQRHIARIERPVQHTYVGDLDLHFLTRPFGVKMRWVMVAPMEHDPDAPWQECDCWHDLQTMPRKD
jgi:hypothetical protein